MSLNFKQFLKEQGSPPGTGAGAAGMPASGMNRGGIATKPTSPVSNSKTPKGKSKMSPKGAWDKPQGKVPHGLGPGTEFLKQTPPSPMSPAVKAPQLPLQPSPFQPGLPSGKWPFGQK